MFENPYVSTVSGHMRRRDKHSPCVRMMKKIYERLRERLGHKPTVKNFDAFLVTLGPDERESWKMDVCSLGYGGWKWTCLGDSGGILSREVRRGTGGLLGLRGIGVSFFMNL